MFCSNCGSRNDKKQNYCRFCGLNLQAAAKSLTTQIVFGRDSDSLKKLSAVKRTVDVASTILVGALFAGVVADIFFVVEWSDELMKISLGLLILFQIIQAAVGYFQRKGGSKSRAEDFRPNEVGRFDTNEPAKLPEDRPFEPVASIVENTTELLTVESKTRKFE